MTVRWSIVSTMHGVPETVLPCIAHYLHSDAEFVHVYLDAPNPPIEAALVNHPRCKLTVCTDSYWSRLPTGRPEGKIRRQRANLRHCIRTAQSNWLVHVDSDEFLVSREPSPRLTLGPHLAQVPTHHEWARFAPLERVLRPDAAAQNIFDGVFRLGTGNTKLIKQAYGAGAAFLNNGLSGHTRGKVAFRRNTKLIPRLHDVVYPQPPGTKTPGVVPVDQLPPFTQMTEFQLLHFEGWTALNWVTKLLRFIENDRLSHHNRGRRAAIQYMIKNTDRETRHALFDLVQRLSSKGYDLLERHKLLRLEPFNPIALTLDMFPGTHFDFSVDAFDARLRASDADFYHRMNL